jgi:hypothetical protein
MFLKCIHTLVEFKKEVCFFPSFEGLGLAGEKFRLVLVRSKK